MSSYVTTNLVGGLGNQLFLVANLLATARRSGLVPVMPRLAESSSVEQPRPVYWDSVFAELPRFGVRTSVPAGCREVVVPERRPVAPVRLSPAPHTAYNMVGFFQSDGFFSDWPTVVAELLPARLPAAARDRLRRCYGCGADGAPGTHSIALHLRRGDYTRLSDTFEQLGHDYYGAALAQLAGRTLRTGTDRLRVLVFCEEVADGDALAAALRASHPGLDVRLVHPREEAAAAAGMGSSAAGDAPREVLELLMMAQCDDVVMANSSFSWWAAYLNAAPLRRVVAPSRWFVQHPYPLSNHLYCDGWMLL